MPLSPAARAKLYTSAELYDDVGKRGVLTIRRPKTHQVANTAAGLIEFRRLYISLIHCGEGVELVLQYPRSHGDRDLLDKWIVILRAGNGRTIQQGDVALLRMHRLDYQNFMEGLIEDVRDPNRLPPRPVPKAKRSPRANRTGARESRVINLD